MGIAILVVAVLGFACSLAAVAVALDTAYLNKNEKEIQELYVLSAVACLLLCFVYGAMCTPGAVPWYQEKWNLLLVFALTPSVFGSKQLLFNCIFVRVVDPVSDNVTSFRKSS